MTGISLLALALIVAAAIPLAWSSALALARAGLGISRWQRIIATERAEQLVLALMIAPVLLGFAFIATALLAPAAVSALPPIVRIVPQVLPAPAFVPQAAGPHIDWTMLLTLAAALLYCAGAIYMLARFVRARLRLRKILRQAADASDIWGGGVAITDAHVPPFASGRTNIILPRSLILVLSPDQVAMVVRHEQAHLHRRDPALFLAYALTEIALWFNPAVRRQLGRCRLAAEFACDRAAISSTPMRKAYAQSLVLALKHGSGDAMFCAPAVVPSGNLGDYHMRMIEIMQPAGRLPVRAPLIAALLLSGPVIALQVTLAGAAVPDQPAIAAPSEGPAYMIAPSERPAYMIAPSDGPAATAIVTQPAYRVTADPALPVGLGQAAEYASGEGDGAVRLNVTIDQVAENAPQPRGNPANWVTVDDYPYSATMARQEGITGFRIIVGADGRPTGCTVTSSSGTPELDATACNLARRRARFEPVDGADGRTFDSSITWKLPG